MIQLTDKHKLLKQFKSNQLNKSLTMFEWSNLPDTIPQVELEKMLQINGYAVIAEYQGNLYAFQAGFSGQDPYNQPTKAIVNNPALKNNTTYTIGENCIVIKNDDMKQGLNGIYEYYGQRLIENQITMLMTDYNLRMPFTISSSDDQTTQSAKMYLKKIIDGSLGVIGEQKLFKALSVTPTNSKQTATFSDLYGYQQFIIAQLNNTIGLATNNNMKRERLTTNEIEVNKNASYPLVDNMLKNRQQAVAAINEMFDVDISVEYSSIWRGINDNSDNSISDNGNNENNGAVSDNDNAIADNSNKAVNDNELNGDSDSDNSSNGVNQSTTGGNEQPEETNKKSEQPADENGAEEPQPDNEPTKETRETSKEKVDNEPENDGKDNNNQPDGNDENVSDNTSDDDTPSNDDDVSNDDEKKKERDKK